MAEIEHKNLPDSELHEPKGVSSAVAGSVYVADGSGSGDWTNIDSLIASTYNINENLPWYTVNSGGSITGSNYTSVIIPFDGVIKEVMGNCIYQVRTGVGILFFYKNVASGTSFASFNVDRFGTTASSGPLNVPVTKGDFIYISQSNMAVSGGGGQIPRTTSVCLVIERS